MLTYNKTLQLSASDFLYSLPASTHFRHYFCLKLTSNKF